LSYAVPGGTGNLPKAFLQNVASEFVPSLSVCRRTLHLKQRYNPDDLIKNITSASALP
jgi:hypothetical protein